MMPKSRTGKSRGEIIVRTTRVANRIHPAVDFIAEAGLKSRITDLMWRFVNENFSSSKMCTWELCCDCAISRNNWTKL